MEKSESKKKGDTIDSDFSKIYSKEEEEEEVEEEVEEEGDD